MIRVEHISKRFGGVNALRNVSVTRQDTGILVNGFDRTVRNPAVTVFPVNRVSRPLGFATRESDVEVPPGESWNFETAAVDAPGESWIAYPAAALDD